MNSITDDRVTSWSAARTSCLLGLLFLVVYVPCNYLAGLRHDVGTWVYPWERYIPFVPIFIVPYMSIDLFFIAAPFLCRDRGELKIFSRRMMMAMLIAGFFFFAMPLRFTFERPHVDGWLGVIFNNFRQMDQPFNQFPSLHIAFRTILADLYVRHTRGVMRWASHIWFSLIGASTLLVYQHHIADVCGGFALAGLCFYVISDRRLPVTVNARVGMMYLCGAAILTVIAIGLRAWWMWLLWPATAMGVQSAAYFGAGPGMFRKRDGRLPTATIFVLWPILLAQRLSLAHYARRSNPWDEITDRLWLGRTLSDREANQALAKGVSAVLDVTVELPENRLFRELPDYFNLPILDLTAPTPQQMNEAIAFIDAQRTAGQTVYVHCKAGYSRSGAIVGAYLIHTKIAANAAEAIDSLRKQRPGIILRPEAVAALSV